MTTATSFVKSSKKTISVIFAEGNLHSPITAATVQMLYSASERLESGEADNIYVALGGCSMPEAENKARLAEVCYQLLGLKFTDAKWKNKMFVAPSSADDQIKELIHYVGNFTPYKEVKLDILSVHEGKVSQKVLAELDSTYEQYFLQKNSKERHLPEMVLSTVLIAD